MTMRAADLLREEYPLADDEIKRVSDATFELDTIVCSYEGVGRFVLGLLEEIDIVSPPEFIEFLKKKTQKLND